MTAAGNNGESPPRSCRDAAERHALMERAFALGIPRDYGHIRKLRMQREPTRLVPIGADIHGRVQWLQPRAARALARMRRAAADADVQLQVVSAFRSIEYQLGIIERKRARGMGMDEILRVSAAPGYSEHHGGRCVDFTTPGHEALEEEFERSPAFRWLERNATRYGFALSYPRGNPHGIAYEPWHWTWHARLYPR
jgi:D-alanyl-D-alanine carboxypeptidase